MEHPMATIHRIFGNSKPAQASEVSSPTLLTRAMRDVYRRISLAEEQRLLKAARAEDFRLSLSRQVKELAASELTASDSMTEKDVRLKARRAAYRRARTQAAAWPEHLAAPHCEAFILLLLEAGFRPLPALTLKWSDVDEEAATVSLEESKYAPRRTFRVSVNVLALLGRLPRTSPRVFDLSYPALSAAWRSICKRSNLPLHLATLRHEAVCRAVESGRLQPWQLRAFLGLRPERGARQFFRPACVF
jgi:integrase